MRLTYNRDRDSAYIWLVESKPAESQSVHHANTQSLFVLDFDEQHRLVGVEIRDASKALPDEVLADAEPGGPDPSWWDEGARFR